MNIDLKYDLDQEIYVILNKKILKSKIEKIRIIKYKPYQEVLGSGKLIDHNGIKIEYLVINYDTMIGSIRTSNYEWFDENDVYGTKDELIRAIE